MANYNQLKTRAQQVRDEQTIGGNTALRVGQLLMDMVDAESETVDNIVELFTGTEDNPVIPTLPNPGLLHWLQSPIVALVSMGEDLDGDAGAVVQEGDLYYYNHSGYQIFVKGSGSLPGTGYKAHQKVLYLNKYTGKLYEWTGADMSEIVLAGTGGGGGHVVAFSQYVMVGSVAELPDPGDPTTGYIIGQEIYAYVGTGGDTLSGKYQDLGSLVGAGGVGIVSITTAEDGTVVFNLSNGDSYTIDMNHTHDDMVKLVVDAAEDLPDPEDMSADTIYAAVDDGEITVIYLGGYPFYGGGGGSSTPRLISPANGSTIECGTNQGRGVEKTITVKGMNLTAALTVAITGTGFSIKNGTSSISASDANAGTTLTIVYSGTSANATGALSFTSSTDGINSSIALEADYEDPYADIIYDKACKYSSNLTTIDTVPGYCMTPQIVFPTNHQLRIHFGFKDASSAGTKYGAAGWKTANGSGLPAACFTSDAGDANTERNIPTSGVNNGNPPYTFIAATFKTSELDDCFLYDLTSQEWLFAGVNVDKSNPPTNS